MKKSNGITLIALVITIIVLLILAGVSIATLSGENGIVTKAKEAAQKTEEGEKKEQEDLEKIESWIEEASGEGFPFGTLYSFNPASGVEAGYVIYSNGKAEVIFIETFEGETITSVEVVLDCSVNDKTLTITDGDMTETLEIADDYSKISDTENNITFTKTTKTYTYCSHTWTTTTELDGELHKCSKCGIFGVHDVSTQTATNHSCECGLSEAHTFNSNGSCDVCGYGCSHTNTTTSKNDIGSGKHTVTVTCSDCSQQVNQTTEDHALSAATYADNGDGTHTATQTCSECNAIVTTSENHNDEDGDNTCDDCSVTITVEENGDETDSGEEPTV